MGRIRRAWVAPIPKSRRGPSDTDSVADPLVIESPPDSPCPGKTEVAPLLSCGVTTRRPIESPRSGQIFSTKCGYFSRGPRWLGPIELEPPGPRVQVVVEDLTR